MFLFDKNGDYIDVYKLEPNMKEIKKYRKKEMEKIPENERICSYVPEHGKQRCLRYYFEYDGEDSYEYGLVYDGYRYSLFEYGDLRLDGNGNYVRDVVINIPETLYLLEALFQGRTNLIGKSDISSQLGLFNIEYVDTIACNLLKNMCDYKLINESYDSIMGKMETNENVMKRVRKLAGK